VKRIYVGNFSFDTTEADLRELFSAYGCVKSVSVVTDPETGRSRQYGFIEMNNDGEAAAAVAALSGKNSVVFHILNNAFTQHHRSRTS